MRRGTLALGLGLLLLAGAQEADARSPDGACHSFGGATTLDIGDSHTVLPGCDAQADWDVDARIGRDSTEGLAALDEWLRPRHEEVVFDIATNDLGDPARLRANLHRVLARIGERDLMLVTTWIVCCPDVSPGRVDDVIEDVAAAHPRRVQVAEWDDVAREHPDYFGPDGIHLTMAGYGRRLAFVRRQAARSPMRGRLDPRPRRGSPLIRSDEPPNGEAWQPSSPRDSSGHWRSSPRSRSACSRGCASR